MPFYISPPPRNPVASILTGIVGIVLMAGAFMLGFVVLVVVFGIGLLIWAGIYIRLWWARRQMARQGIDPAPNNPFAENQRPTRQDSLEGEYEVISKNRDDK